MRRTSIWVAVLWALSLCACGDDDSGPSNQNQNTNGGGAICGNGQVEWPEECDDGAENSDTTPDACRSSCNLPRCGDDTTDTGEECDDGNFDPADGCGPTCMVERCGNGVLDPSEACDDGNTENGDGSYGPAFRLPVTVTVRLSRKHNPGSSDSVSRPECDQVHCRSKPTGYERLCVPLRASPCRSGSAWCDRAHLESTTLRRLARAARIATPGSC